MSLVPHKIVALEGDTATAISTGKTTIASAVVVLYDSDNNAITLYDDAAFTNGASSKVTGSTGELIVWITAGQYTQSVNGSTALPVTVGSASPVTVDTFANMLLLRPEQTDQSFTCQERANAKYILKVSGYVALAGDATFANDRVAALQVSGPLNILQVGVSNTGLESIAEFRLAALRFKSIYFPEGTYLFAIPAGQSQGVTPIGGAKWYGDNRSADITFQINDLTFKNIISFENDGLEINGLKITIDNTVNENCKLVRVLASDLKLIDNYFEGGVTDNGSTLSYDCSLIAFPTTGTQNNVHADGNEITGYVRTQLKTNTTTSTQNNIKWTNNWCHHNYVSDLGGFNSPSGIIQNVLIADNAVTDGLGEAIGVLHIPFGGASPKNVRITGNYCSGLYSQILHIEEDMDNVVVSNNTFECDVSASSGSAINVLENSVGGALHRPKRVVISNNTLKKTGVQKEAGTVGIWVTTDADADTAGEHVIISNNVIEGYAIGVAADSEIKDFIKINDNAVDACTTGYAFTKAYNIDCNSSANCDVGLKVTEGGMVTSHKFFNCTVNAAADNVPFVLSDSEYYFDDIVVDSNTTEFITLVSLNANSRCGSGILSGNTYAEGSNSARSNVEATLVFDGSSETITSSYTLQPASTQTSFVDQSNVLKYALFSSVDRTLRGNVKLSGNYLVGH